MTVDCQRMIATNSRIKFTFPRLATHKGSQLHRARRSSHLRNSIGVHAYSLGLRADQSDYRSKRSAAPRRVSTKQTCRPKCRSRRPSLPAIKPPTAARARSSFPRAEMLQTGSSNHLKHRQTRAPVRASRRGRAAHHLKGRLRYNLPRVEAPS